MVGYVLLGRPQLCLLRCAGRDLLPHMLAGGVASNGAMDLSGCYTAVLWRGGCMVAAAVFRVHSAGLAEVPLLATRPQAQAS